MTLNIVLWNIFIQRWQSFLFERENQSSFSISKIRYPCHQYIWYPKLMIFLQLVVPNTFTLGSQQNSTSVECCSIHDIWRWPMQHVLTSLFIYVTISQSACFFLLRYSQILWEKAIPYLSQFKNTDFIIPRLLRVIIMLN